MHAPLLRQATDGGWRFMAQPKPDGTSWLLQNVRPKRATVSEDATVYELAGGHTLTDYFSGALLLTFRSGDHIIIDPDGTCAYERADGSLRSTLDVNGVELEYWVDGPRQVHQSWARVTVFDGR